MKLNSNPHITKTTAPLESLIMDALREFGGGAPDALTGDVKAMMLHYANNIVEEFNDHPYNDDDEIPLVPFYATLQDRRPIEDRIMVAGLLYYYAFQQASSKAAALQGNYFRTMNQTLYFRRYGRGRPELQKVE